MIKYNNNTINDWYFYTSDIVKVYRNNAICYYKITVGGGQVPCYAVVDDISQYSDTEFEDVFNKADGKWYKLNNLNQYEEYGVYGSGRTSCEGSTSRLPQGYTEVEYIENTSTAYINTDLQIYSSTTNSFEVEAKLIAAKHDSQTYQNVFSCMSEDGEPYQGFVYRYQSSSLAGTSIPNGQNTFTIVNNDDSTQTVTVTSSSSQRTYTHTYPLTLFCGLNSSRSPFRWTNSKFYYCKIRMNDELVRDFVPAKRDNDDKYGMYDLVTNTFYLSPNNVDFSGGDPVTPTDCVTTYEGKLTIDDSYEYEWNGSSWVNLGEVSGSSRLPQGYTEVEYVENTSSAYINTNLVLLENIGDSFEIKVKTYFTPYGSDFEYLFGTEQTSAPYTGIQLRYYQRNLQYNSDSNVVWTHIDNGDGTSGVTASCSSINATNGGNPLTLFCGLWSTGPWRFGRGKIYSFKVTKNDTLVRDLVPCKRDSDNKYGMYDLITDTFYLSPNGNNFIGGEPITPTEYPKYYDEIQDPPDNLVFSSMAEAEAYECPWYGMSATIGAEDYMFCEGNEWLTKYSYVEVSGEYICDNGDKYKKMQEYDRQADGTFSPSSNYVKGDLIESGSPDCQNICLYNFCGVDANGNDVIINGGTSTLDRNNFSSPYPVEGIVGEATTIIGQYCFQNIKSTLSALTIGDTVTTIQHEAFMETALLKTLTIPSSVTQIDFWAFTRCNGLTEVIFEGTTPPTFTNQYSGVFHDYCPPVIYVPDSAVSVYRAIDGSVWTNQSWSTNIIQPISNRT